jgi:tetratricopeptide (TPR) repeat protein
MIVPAAVVLAGLASFFGGEAHRRTEQGNEHYLEGKQEDALESYQKAQAVAPNAPQLHYDLGNVLYRQENWAGAAQAYEQALGAANPELAQRAAFNLGNALYKDEKFDEAVKAYMRSLKAQPKDGDAKHNLEMALRALQAQKQQQKQNQKQQDQDQKKDDKPQEQQGQPDDDKNKPEDKKSPSGGESKDKKDGSKQPKPGEMSAEDAGKLLDRLNDQERDNLKKEAARRAQPRESTPEKDW